MIHISVQQDVFDLGAEMARLTEGDAGIGAVASFVGLVRDSNQVGEQASGVSTLTLEHYPGMTEKALQRIAEQATQRWQLQAVTIVHRVGDLHPGDPIVLVLTASPHRHDAFDACQFVMDILKTQAPFWKKETLPDGVERWVDSRQSDDDAAARWEDDGF
jgi:molybdopterin synthase catalytic subunit